MKVELFTCQFSSKVKLLYHLPLDNEDFKYGRPKVAKTLTPSLFYAQAITPFNKLVKMLQSNPSLQ